MRLNCLLFLLFTIVCATVHAGSGFAIKTVVIDAGHGGKDPGAIGPGKTNEKDVALAVALKLGDYIKKSFPAVNVIYTRKTDVFVELHERADIANKAKADLFIAIHCNSSTSPSVYGTSTYVLGLHRTEANLEVAKRENAVILLEDDRDKNYEFDPNTPEGNIIMSMRQNAFLDQSIDIASKIEAQYESSAKRKSLGVKQAGFYVIYKTAMPSLLSEIGFISNPTEEKFLASDKGQEQIANSLLKAFKDYKFEMENSEGEQTAYQEAQRKAQKVDSSANTVKVTPSNNQAQQTPTNTSDAGTVKPATTTSAEQVDPDNITITLLSGRKIKKPIDNASGGGVSPDAVKPVETPPVKTENKPVASAPATNSTPIPDTVAAPKPVVVVKKEPKPVVKDTVAAPVTEVKKVTAGHSGGAVVKADTVVKPATKPVVAEPAPVKPQPKPVTKEPVVTKSEDKPAAAVKPEKKPVEAEASSKPAVKPAIDNTANGVMTFKVQLIALKGPMRPSEVTKMTKALGEISNETIPSGLIRYYSGNSKTYAEAKRKAAIAAELGYKDAFIVGFKNGVRFGPEKLKAYENQ